MISLYRKPLCAPSRCDFVALWNLHFYFSISQGFGCTYFCKIDGTALHRLRQTPLILVSRCSSCFSCAILWTVTPPSYSNRTVPSIVQLYLSFSLPFHKIYSLVWILFCQDQETYGVYFQNHYCLQWMMAVLASDSGALWTSGNPCDNPIPQKK